MAVLLLCYKKPLIILGISVKSSQVASGKLLELSYHQKKLLVQMRSLNLKVTIEILFGQTFSNLLLLK